MERRHGTGRRCSKIKRRYQQANRPQWFILCRPRLFSCNGRRFRPGTDRRPRVMVAARVEGRRSGSCDLWCEPVGRALQLQWWLPRLERARDCSEAPRFMSPLAFSARVVSAPLSCASGAVSSWSVVLSPKPILVIPRPPLTTAPWVICTDCEANAGSDLASMATRAVAVTAVSGFWSRVIQFLEPSKHHRNPEGQILSKRGCQSTWIHGGTDEQSYKHII